MDVVGWFGVGIAFITLAWVEWIKPWWYAPKLKIEFENGVPYCKSSPTDFYGDSRPAYWVRLRIRNAGRSSAMNCIGKMLEVRDEQGTCLERYDPETLAWRGLNRGPIDLAPHDFEYLDVWLTAKDISDMLVRVYDYTDRGGQFRFGPGKYTIKVTILADNSKPSSQVFEVAWNGIYNQIRMLPETPSEESR
jgi:hypothetical protein